MCQISFVRAPGPWDQKVMKKNTKNTAKFGKLLEIIANARIGLMEGKSIDMKTIDLIQEKTEYLYSQYKNYVPAAAKVNRQLQYLKFKTFVEGKK
jgi:hypothetical protein